jgi:hypothetical protein
MVSRACETATPRLKLTPRSPTLHPARTSCGGPVVTQTYQAVWKAPAPECLARTKDTSWGYTGRILSITWNTKLPVAGPVVPQRTMHLGMSMARSWNAVPSGTGGGVVLVSRDEDAVGRSVGRSGKEVCTERGVRTGTGRLKRGRVDRVGWALEQKTETQ